ncbi:Y-family DNA polymerase [Azohydromonas lata]|uniref:Y-family DNA polymerase n=1 Tax=Azohydromonas lata TaxID=45677 RepID=UPI00082AE7B9|nr:DNA polymerase Y family protein [Azohydromonas lata]
MLWAAACTPAPPTEGAPAGDPPALAALSHWALQFTPRVARVEEAVLMELRASLRLFGGAAALRARMAAEALELGACALSWGASTGLAALALARAGHAGCTEADGAMDAATLADKPAAAPLCALLDGLALHTLSAARAHVPTLLRTGCSTLGGLRRLPRGGLSRRFGGELLQALDQAYGLRPEAWRWFTLPETFALELELPWRVEQAPALAQAARRLLLALCGWLAARHGGATAFTLYWAHDAMRSRAAGAGGELTLRTAEPTRDVAFLQRLLGEHLHRTALLAPAGALGLRLQQWQPLAAPGAGLLPDGRDEGEPLSQVLQRLSARLGEERVRRPLLVADHRPEWMQRWLSVQQGAPRPSALPPAQATLLPQPGFVLAQPLRLALKDNRPVYQGPLQLVAGPHRIEGGWWHRLGEEAGLEHGSAGGQGTPGGPGGQSAIASGHVQRDYWLAWSPHAGLLWIFQTRLADEASAWYLHGSFA